MKCIQTYPPNSGVDRVTEDEAAKIVNSGRGMYVPKSVWKKAVRDAGKGQ